MLEPGIESYLFIFILFIFADEMLFKLFCFHCEFLQSIFFYLKKSSELVQNLNFLEF